MTSVRIIQHFIRGVSIRSQQPRVLINQTCRFHQLQYTLPCSKVSQVRFYAKKGKKHSSRIDLKHSADEEILDLHDVEHKMQSVLDHLKEDYVKQLSVRTSPGSLDHILVMTKDGKIPLNQLGQINMVSAQKFSINMTSAPEAVNAAVKAISDAGMNLNPQSEGTMIQVPIPKVTREHREHLSKTAKTMCDKAKVNVRNVRSKVMNDIKQHKDHASKDVLKMLEKQVQQLTDDFNASAEQLLVAKNKELLGK